MESQKFIEGRLEPYGLTSPQGRLLGLISDLHLRGQVPVQRDLESQMGLVTSSITSLVQGLEKKGLIERREAPDDGRAKQIYITPAGQKIVEDFAGVFDEVHQKFALGLGEEEILALEGLLRRVAGNFS